MIYVISEDNFFAIGVMAVLEKANMNVIHVSLDEFRRVSAYIGVKDIILMCVQSRLNSLALGKLARSTGGKVIFFIDTAVEKSDFDIYYKRIVSKKALKEELITSIKFLESKLFIDYISLSQQEVVVMDLFLQQKNAYHIAEKLNLSAKTVFAHKLNALRKLGLSHLNARSMLLYECIFQTRF